MATFVDGIRAEVIGTILGGLPYLRVGAGAVTSHGLASPNDAFIVGKIEVDGVAFFDSNVTVAGLLAVGDNINVSFGAGNDANIKYQPLDADAKVLMFIMDESDDAGNNVPAFVFGEHTTLNATDLGLFDWVVQPLVTVVDLDGDSWFGITMSADDTPTLSIGGSATGIEIQGTLGVVQRMAYAQIMEILGDVSGFWPNTEITGAASVPTDFTANGQDGTPSKDISTWDTKPAYQGSVQVYTHDGVDEEWDVADNPLFSTAGAFSVGIAFYLTEATDTTLIAVWDVDSTFREFRFYFDASDYLSFDCYDESGDDTIGREYQTGVSEDVWHTGFATFNGGTDPADITIYLDGVAVDDNDTTDDGGFADIEDTGAALMMGHIISSGVANLFAGKEWGKFYTKKELSADECWNLHQIYRGVLNF